MTRVRRKSGSCGAFKMAGFHSVEYRLAKGKRTAEGARLDTNPGRCSRDEFSNIVFCARRDYKLTAPVSGASALCDLFGGRGPAATRMPARNPTPDTEAQAV